MPLFANAGIPMLAVVWPVAWIAFLPVVAIESLIARTGLDLRYRRALLVTGAANAASTFVGIPVAWFLLVIASAVTGGAAWQDYRTTSQAILTVFRSAPWLAPYELDLGWMIPLAAILLCVPFYFVSVLIEYLVIRRMIPNDRGRVLRFCWRANLWTYLGFALFYVGTLLASVYLE